MSSEEIKAEYTSSLADLTFNSRPLINVLTMLAEENIQNAPDIVEAIETHLTKVHTDVKLPILYLIDCIVKNVRGTYTELFSQNIVSTFCSVFKVVDEKTRAEMFKLRQTWNEVFPQKKLYAIDVQIKSLDPAWPVTAQAPSNSIHFNPKFLKTPSTKLKGTMDQNTTSSNDTLRMQQQLIEKQKELLELQQKKLELELLQTQVKLRESSNNIAVSKDPRKAFNHNAVVNKKPAGIGASAGNSRPQGQNNVNRINPVNSTMINAMKRNVNRDPRLQKQTNNTGNKQEPGQKSDTNVPSKVNVRIDPRLNNANKDAPKADAGKPKSPLKSSKSDKPRSATKNGSDTSKSSQDDEKKDKNDKSRSPSKKDKDKKKDKYEDKKSSSSRPKKSSAPETGLSAAAFKEVKSRSNRNYLRRNRSPSESPERVHDVDLRSFGPPEKQMRLQGDTTDEKSGNNKDVDLRQIPALVGKKRASTETLDANVTKKSKTEVLDILFGNEDTDLRKLSSVQNDRPPTPPPPIISSTVALKIDPDIVEIPSDSPPKKKDLDAVRAKLTNVTNRDKIFSKSFHKKKLAAAEEQDTKSPLVSSSTDVHPQIIISAADAQAFEGGQMTKEKQQQLLSKILLQMEKNQLNEAKKKDQEETIGNISTQTISDDEFDEAYNSEEERERERFKKEVYGTNREVGDRDTRLKKEPNEEHTVNNQYNANKFGGGPRWGGHWRGGRRRHWDMNNPQMHPHGMPPRPGMRPWGPMGGPPQNWRPMGPRHMLAPKNDFIITDDDRKSPEGSSDLVVEPINSEEIKSIVIDGMSREIRYYDEVAIIFMKMDDPREISFQDATRRVTFNDKDSYVLSFNQPYQDVLVNGEVCKVRLGVPSREIYINYKPYECYFGGPGITVELGGSNVLVKLDGPPPQVKIGRQRTDLVAGRVNLIINAKKIIPVFLDAKPQKFVLDGETLTLRFVDSLKTVLINDCPFKVEFGGLPKPVTIHGTKHFIRFSVLPNGVKPGHVRIKDMEVLGQSPSHIAAAIDETSRDGSEKALPILASKRALDSPDNSNSAQFFQNILQQTNSDMLSSVIASATSQNPTSGGYQIDATSNSDSQPGRTESPGQLKDAVLPPLNINDLFQKLVATGIVATSSTKSEPHQPAKPHIKLPVVEVPKAESPPPKRNPMELIKLVTFDKPETLKVAQAGLYNILYTGMQCSSCGMRFPPEHSIHYSQHLDWHFRQNRRGKRNIRVASSRKWYYTLSDWKNYEEIEDLEEREKNFFDQQATQAEGQVDEAEEEVEIPTVLADPSMPNDQCEVCKDPFDQFFNEEREEWHLRNAIRIDDKCYHPVCHSDLMKSLQDSTMEENQSEHSAEEPVKEKKEVIPGLQIVLDDDEEARDVEILESDEEKKEIQEEKEEPEEPAEEQPMEDDGDDDDVILNEVAPIKIVLDDDDDDEDDEYVPTPSTNHHVKIKKERVEVDDGFEDVGGLISLPNGGTIKIKAEPIDHDEIAPLDASDPNESLMNDKEELEEPETPQMEQQAPTTGFITTIDGNVELASDIPTTTTASKGIKINISKPLAVIASKEPIKDESETMEQVIDPSQPLPPGEEPVQLSLKPSLRGVELKKMPPVRKGSELSGLCSIM
ncbi:uncharacterized protein LOC109601802 isoform X2 [Aethina tumida]|uniref:uncharacterized protein LOC109601802 isoform X2 n=1 Tax=Aethina tumida TaxID=116153 RepID=UPI002147BBEA|nr:uncharacterized protein LOC109601802 isoform X2 [Aethina tumida]